MKLAYQTDKIEPSRSRAHLRRVCRRKCAGERPHVREEGDRLRVLACVRKAQTEAPRAADSSESRWLSSVVNDACRGTRDKEPTRRITRGVRRAVHIQHTSEDRRAVLPPLIATSKGSCIGSRGSAAYTAIIAIISEGVTSTLEDRVSTNESSGPPMLHPVVDRTVAAAGRGGGEIVVGEAENGMHAGYECHANYARPRVPHRVHRCADRRARARSTPHRTPMGAARSRGTYPHRLPGRPQRPLPSEPARTY